MALDPGLIPGDKLIIGYADSAAFVGGQSSTIQGTVMSAKQSGSNIELQVVSTSPDQYAVGEVIEISGENITISSVSKPNVESKSGKTLLQRETNIPMPTNGSIKFNKIQIIMEF
jgi:hypothetical protein